MSAAKMMFVLVLTVIANAVVYPAQATPIIVPGYANPWLAGTPDGTVGGNGYDTAPAQSPVSVTTVPIAGGDVFTFAATGIVSHGDDDSAGNGPVGDLNNVLSRDSGAENGIADLLAPVDALIGVFLDNNSPISLTAPATLDFSTQAARNFLTLSPVLRQPFYIGDGQTSTEIIQQFIAPAGATRLFLGIMDGHEWSNNSGEFIVNVPAPEPSTLSLSVIALAFLLARGWRSHRRRTGAAA